VPEQRPVQSKVVCQIGFIQIRIVAAFRNKSILRAQAIKGLKNITHANLDGLVEQTHIRSQTQCVADIDDGLFCVIGGLLLGKFRHTRHGVGDGIRQHIDHSRGRGAD
jgi:hypothetical protein